MSCFTFECDIEILGDPQKQLVESVLQKRGFKDGKVLVEPVGKKGDNYVAHVKRFICEGKDGATFKMVGKIATTCEELRVMMNTVQIFNNEILMYNVVLSKLNNIQNSACNITEDEKVRFPICYGVVTEAPFEFILLEDLNESGFQMLDRFQPLSNECVRLVLKDIARYHSLYYVLKHSEPETYKNVVSKTFNVWSTLDVPETKRFFEMSVNALLQLMYDTNEKYIKVLTDSLIQMGAIAKQMESYEKSSKFSVIQQGDCWNNNILFRFEDGKPVQDVMIDYQLSRETNPASDILSLIFNCTDHALRLKHYQEWIDYYHENLDDSLNNYGLKANRVFPRDQLDADLRRYGRTMVNSSVLLSAMIVRQGKDAVDFKEIEGEKTENVTEETISQMSLSTLDASTITTLKERIKGIVDSALEFGLISL